MARIPIHARAALPAEHQDLVPEGSNIFGTLVNSPKGLRRYKQMTYFIREESAIDPRLRELALVQIGYTAKCAYEYTHHIKTALRYGATPDDIRAIAADSAGLPTALEPLARAVLRAARDLTAGYAVSAGAWETLAAGLPTEALVDLLFAVTTYCGTIRMLMTLEVELEDSYRHFLEEYPLETGR